MARNTPDAIYDPFRHPEPSERPCQQEGCSEAGRHRAPRSRTRLNEYYWFCLAHVRAYNLAWDYFVGMDEDQIEGQRRLDTVWERPSWPFGRDPQQAEEAARQKLDEEFGPFRQGRSRRPPARREEDEEALAVMGLGRPITFPEIKARYKELVKQLHPDINGGGKEAEEQLKTVNQAYSILKRSFVQ